MSRVVYLVENYILGIGKRCNAGAGQIVAVYGDEVEEDRSWITAKGKPARPLPVALWREIGGNADMPTVPLAVMLPYWEQEKVDAVFPESLVA